MMKKVVQKVADDSDKRFDAFFRFKIESIWKIRRPV